MNKQEHASAVIRVTKVFHFEMAHALHGYNGKCAQLHGHSYALHVTVKGIPVTDPERSDSGMVIDFGDLKKTVNAAVVNRFDHALLLNERDRGAFDDAHTMFNRVEFTVFQPTCENLLLEIVQALKDRLPDGVTLCALRLWETPNSHAEWMEGDQG
ncbi:MAG: 6-carboxytetrahydropterin synthase [Flavobacteriales bacterium]|nr:6-carboxytetrahydropterin synthase [Flavobacteriales bacterium]